MPDLSLAESRPLADSPSSMSMPNEGENVVRLWRSHPVGNEGPPSKHPHLPRLSSLFLLGLFLMAALFSAGNLLPASEAASYARKVSDMTPPSAQELSEASLRREFGLDATLTTIRRINRDHASTDDESGGLGVPLSHDEALEMQRRRRAGAAIAKLDQDGATDQAYAGAWIDQAAGGILHVAHVGRDRTVTADERDLATLHALLPDSPVELTSAEYSSRQLRALYGKLVAASDLLHARGAGIVSIGNDTSRNRVVVQESASSVAGSEAVLTAEFGPGILVEAGDSPQQAGARDIRVAALFGGEWISQYGGGGQCTVGFGSVVNSVGQVFAISAGHCSSVGAAYVQGLGGGRGIGSVVIDSARHDGGATACDCMIIGKLPGGLPTSEVLVNGNAHYRYTNTGAVYDGEPVCHSGAASYEKPGGGIQCGHVIVSSTQLRYSDMVVNDTFSASMSTIQGDSGAPAGDGPSFLGVLSGFVVGTTWFSKVQHFPQVTPRY